MAVGLNRLTQAGPGKRRQEFNRRAEFYPLNTYTHQQLYGFNTKTNIKPEQRVFENQNPKTLASCPWIAGQEMSGQAGKD
jgi:hypothetical protein